MLRYYNEIICSYDVAPMGLVGCRLYEAIVPQAEPSIAPQAEPSIVPQAEPRGVSSLQHSI